MPDATPDTVDILESRVDALNDGLDRLEDTVGDLEAENDDLRERLNAVESLVERLEATASGPELSKKEKHEAVINAAENKAGGPGGTTVDYAEVMAAANVSRRYAYTLMETMGQAYPWANYDTSKAKHRLIIEPGDRDWAALVASVHKNTSED